MAPGGAWGGDAQRLTGLVHKLAAGLLALVGLFGERPGEHGVDLSGQVGVGGAGRGRVVFEVGEEGGCERFAVEGWLAGEALLEHAGEGVEVSTPVQGLLADLLGSNVVGRAGEVAALERARGTDLAAEPEVGQVDVLAAALGRDEHVGGLDVPVHEAVFVGDIQRFGHLVEQPDGTGGLEPSLLAEEPLEVGALHVAHGDVELPVALGRVVDGQHVRMVDRGGELGLAQQPLLEALVAGQLRRDAASAPPCASAAAARPGRRRPSRRGPSTASIR